MEYKTVTAKEFENNFDEYFSLVENKKACFRINLENGKSALLEPYFEKDEIR